MEDSFSSLIYHLLLDVWISDETLLLVFDILLLASAKILPRSRRNLDNLGEICNVSEIATRSHRAEKDLVEINEKLGEICNVSEIAAR